MASVIVAQLLFLEAENPKKEIAMYINSPGGVVTAGLSIYDTMQFIRPKVSTLCVGQAASMGSLLLAAGEAGLRFALPNARIMVHQPSGGFQGQASDILLHAEEIKRVKRRLNEIYVQHTGRDYEALKKTLDRDHSCRRRRRRPSASSIRFRQASGRSAYAAKAGDSSAKRVGNARDENAPERGALDGISLAPCAGSGAVGNLRAIASVRPENALIG